MNVTLEDLMGAYEISYQSTPQLDGWYEPGFGAAKIEGSKLTGIDGVGTTWNASFQINEDGTLAYEALLDPKNAAPNAGLMNKEGQMTKEPQSYSGIMKVTMNGEEIILRTHVQQGPIRIDVQFRKTK